MNIYSAMNTAKLALFAQQTAIEVTGQNIANVANPDYNRQEISLKAMAPVNVGNHMLGTGVYVSSVQRRFDEFIFSQTLDSNQLLSNWEARENVLDRLDIVLNEANSGGINTRMSELFQSFYNLAINPSGAVERQDVIEKGLSLTDKISYTATELKRIRYDTNQKLTSIVDEINTITSQIVTLNAQIHESETNGATANDYRDARDALLNDLSEIAEITYFEQASNNEIVVNLKNGRPLVIGQTSHTLSTSINSLDPETSSIFWADAAGNTTNITREITGGQMGAWIDLRDDDIVDILRDLDTLVAVIVKEVNKLHSVGYGSDGSTGNNFFTGLTPGGNASVYNTGSGLLGTGSVNNPEIVDLDHFRLTFDGSGSYTVYNIDEDASSGTYTYTDGSDLTFFTDHGISISISGTSGADDEFYISGADDAAFNMSVNSSITNNIERLAAGNTTQLGDGDNARAMADLQYTKLIGEDWDSSGTASGSFTFDDYLASIVGGVGSSTQAAKTGRVVQETISNQLLNMREQASGVSLDEEMINIIKFQNAYGAAAKMITTVDEMLQTLLNIR